MLEFRNLRPDEIQVRMDSCSQKGARFLLYKDARCDMDILDETVGPGNWQRKHYEQKGNMYCSVGVNVSYDDPMRDPVWVWKDDCGSESNTEKEKGEASDSFKRACVNWGIGRELYTKIPAFINIATKDSGRKKPNGQPIFVPEDPWIRFVVSDIQYSGKKITGLQISDTDGIVAFTWPRNYQKAPERVDPKTLVPPPINAVEEAKVKCECCGGYVKATTGKGGRHISIRELTELGKKNYGGVLCADCIKKAESK